MTYRHALAVFAIALGLSACASYPSGYRDNVVYRDGSYYSRGDDSYGDYYYAPAPRYDDYSGYPGFYGPSYFSYGYGSHCWAYSSCAPWGFSGFWGPYSRSGLSIFYRQGGWSGGYGSYWGPYPNRGYRSPRNSRRAPPPRMTPDDDRRDHRQGPPDSVRPRMDRENIQPRREGRRDRSVPMGALDPAGNRIFPDRPARSYVPAGNDNARLNERAITGADRDRRAAWPEAMRQDRNDRRSSPLPAVSPQREAVAMAPRIRPAAAPPVVRNEPAPVQQQAQPRSRERGMDGVQER